MKVTLTNIGVLQQYISGVMERANHHGGDVNEIVLALIGEILWQIDHDSDIEVHARDGDIKNVLWAYIRGTKYAFSYNHEAGQIEMREGSVRGQTIQSFTNETSIRDVKDFFDSL